MENSTQLPSSESWDSAGQRHRQPGESDNVQAYLSESALAVSGPHRPPLPPPIETPPRPLRVLPTLAHGPELPGPNREWVVGGGETV